MECWSNGVVELREKSHLRHSNTPLLRFFHLRFLHLPILKLNRGVTAENIDRDFQLAPVGFDFLDHTAEIEKRTIVDLDRFAHFKVDLRTLLILGFRDLLFDGGNLFLRGWGGLIAPDKTNDTRRIPD